MGKCTAADTTVPVCARGAAVLRLVNCNADGGVSVDPTGMSCGSVGHVMAVLVVTCGLGGGFLVGLPWILRRRIRESMVHSSVEKHERFVQGKELEFILSTSERIWSFTCRSLRLSVDIQWRCQCRCHTEATVASCLLSFAVTATFNGESRDAGVDFLFCSSEFGSVQDVEVSLRCVSTSYLVILVDWMLVANGVFGRRPCSGDNYFVCLVVLLCANGVRSALTVSTSVTSSLTFLNACFLVMIGSKGLHDFALINLTHSLQKPRADEEIIYYGSKVESWVKAIHIAHSTILASLLVIPSMRSCEDLKTALDQVELCTKKLLAGQLYEVSLYVHELYVEAVASSPFHRIGFPTKDMAELTGVLQRRKDRQLLLSTRTRRKLATPSTAVCTEILAGIEHALQLAFKSFWTQNLKSSVCVCTSSNRLESCEFCLQPEMPGHK
ncbi:hypothetical protein GQ600_883 [Phytophthora cactorum]|nr:hypothetical protein GQ600_883 [Phytophthora cactorum]